MWLLRSVGKLGSGRAVATWVEQLTASVRLRLRGEVRCGAVRCGCGAVRCLSTKAVNHQMAMHTDAEG